MNFPSNDGLTQRIARYYEFEMPTPETKNARVILQKAALTTQRQMYTEYNDATKANLEQLANPENFEIQYLSSEKLKQGFFKYSKHLVSVVAESTVYGFQQFEMSVKTQPQIDLVTSRIINSAKYSVELGMFSSKPSAEDFAEELREKYAKEASRVQMDYDVLQTKDHNGYVNHTVRLVAKGDIAKVLEVKETPRYSPELVERNEKIEFINAPNAM